MKSITGIYIFLTFVLGFLFGGFLSREIAAIVSKIIIVLSILILAVFGRKIESTLHAANIQQWEELHTKGKWHFVFTRFVLLRGTSLFTLLIAPLGLAVKISTLTMTASLFGFILLAAALIYLGNEEWKGCEQEYQITILKNLGEQIRIGQN